MFKFFREKIDEKFSGYVQDKDNEDAVEEVSECDKTNSRVFDFLDKIHCKVTGKKTIIQQRTELKELVKKNEEMEMKLSSGKNVK